MYDVLWASGLPNVLTLARRDLCALLVWPPAAVLGVLLIVPASVWGYLLPLHEGQRVTMAGVLDTLALAAAVLTPVATARLLAQEQRSGTLEVLLASPVRPWELVVGKWLGGLLLFLAAAALTLVHLALLSTYERGVDYGAAAAAYLGVVLIGSAWVALGLLASSLTRSLAAAAAAGGAVLLTLELGLGAAAARLAPPWSDLLDYASAASRAQSFDRGQVAVRDVVFFLTLTAGALILTARSVESRRWRG